MQIMFFDTLTVTDSRRTADGYLVADARISRSGIQEYLGSEVGKPELSMVRVYRPEEEVFQADSMASAANKPVTNSHPPVLVTSDNWKKYAVGFSANEVARDGALLRIPLMVTDRQAITDWESGKRQLSAGYECFLDFTPGRTADGQDYDAIQRQIRINHIAMEDRGRGGPRCRLGDANPQPLETDMNLKKITFDGMSIEVTEQGEQAILKLQGQLRDATTAKDTAEGKLTAKDAEHAAALEKKDGEITVLKTQIPDAAAMDAAVTARTKLVADAKKLGGDKIVTDGKSGADIRRNAVAVKLGDAAVKDKSDDYVHAAFDALVAATGTAGNPNDPLRDAINTGVRTTDGASVVEQAHTAMVTNLEDAWKGPAAKAA